MLLGFGVLRVRSHTVFAHRGFASEAPENTVEAVERAAPRADAIEIDVRRCGSGELVLFHDETLDRLTDATGRVDETDWERLRTLTVADSGALVPRFEDVLEAVPSDTLLNVELKERGLAPDLLEAIAGEEFDVLVSSFDRTALTQVRSLAPDLPLAYIFRDDPAGGLRVAEDLDCVAIHPRKGLCVETDLVDDAHDRGFDVNAWTVDSRTEAASLALRGVDGVFADRPIW